MGASKFQRPGLKARIERLRTLQPPMVIAVDGHFLAPGSREYEKELKALAESLSSEEFEGLVRAEKAAGLTSTRLVLDIDFDNG